MDNRKFKSFLFYFGCIALSGVLLALSMPPYGFSWLAFISFTPILILARQNKPLISFGIGMLSAIITGAILTGKIADAAQYANVVAAFGTLTIAIGLVLNISSFFKKTNMLVWVITTACAGVFSEWLMSRVFAVSVAISQHQQSWALDLSSILGFWIVTFLIWLASAYLAAFIFRPEKHTKALLEKSLIAVSIILIITIFVVPVFFITRGKVIKAAAIQAPDDFTLAEETAKLKGVSIVVWPENNLDPVLNKAFESAKKNNVCIAANFLEPRENAKSVNVSYLISSMGNIEGKCKKMHLFGKETLTYQIYKDKQKAIYCKELGIKVGIPTCYDTMYTDVIRDYVKDGAKLILVPNCDPEAPNGIFGIMHAGMTAFRAAENGVGIVMADPYCISTIFGRNGEVLAQTKPQSITSIQADVPVPRIKNIYTKIGDVFVYVCILWLLIVSYINKSSQKVL